MIQVSCLQLFLVLLGLPSWLLVELTSQLNYPIWKNTAYVHQIGSSPQGMKNRLYSKPSPSFEFLSGMACSLRHLQEKPSTVALHNASKLAPKVLQWARRDMWRSRGFAQPKLRKAERFRCTWFQRLRAQTSDTPGTPQGQSHVSGSWDLTWAGIELSGAHHRDEFKFSSIFVGCCVPEAQCWPKEGSTRSVPLHTSRALPCANTRCPLSWRG